MDLQRKRGFQCQAGSYLYTWCPKKGGQREERERAAGSYSDLEYMESIRANLKERIIKRCGDKCENITKW